MAKNWGFSKSKILHLAKKEPKRAVAAANEMEKENCRSTKTEQIGNFKML